MTVNIAYSAATDGDLNSIDSNYNTARNGPADTINTSSTRGYFGQDNNAGYALHQTFLSFTFSAITDLLAASYFRLYSAVQHSTGVSRDLELRGVAWSGGGLSTGEWATPATLAAARLDGLIVSIQNSVNSFVYAGSDELRGVMTAVTALDEVVVSSRERAGNTPTTDERSAIATSDESGTTYDPALVWTTAPRSVLTPHLTAAVELAGGGFAELYGTGAAGSAVKLRAWSTAGLSWEVTLATGTAVGEFDVEPTGTQGFTLVRDGSDNLYVIGKAGSAENALCAQAFVKTGALSWVAGTARVAAMPVYDASINNVSAAYHSTASGTIMVAVGHTAGAGNPGGTGNELAYALLDATYLRTGSGTFMRASGSMLGTIMPALTSAAFNGFGNETGTDLDVAADLVQADWGYVISVRKDQVLGENKSLYAGRYILNAAGNGFTHTSSQSGVGWHAKDAATKLRAVPVGDGLCAFITTDTDAGFGISVGVFQAQGSTAGLVELGGAFLADATSSMPDGPAVGAASWWDAVYSSADNSLWIYYRHASDATKVMRTRFSLDTYQATGDEVTVLDSANTVIGVRVPRNAVVTSRTRVQVATLNGSTHALTQVVDSFNIAPLAPTLTPKANYDATAASTFTWAFNDQNAGDTQSAYDFQVQRTDTNASVVSTGKTTSSTSSRNVTGGTLTNGLSYRWRVRTWDAEDAVGPWSGWGTFSASAGGAVTITDPATDNPATLITDEIQISWSVTGTTQAAYRVIVTRNDTAGTVSDTGWVTSTATELLISGLVSDVEHTVSVQVRNAGLVVSGIGTRLLTPNYGRPETPIVTVQPVAEEGYVLITVSNPISGQPSLGTTVDTMESGISAWTPISATAAWSTEQAHGGTRSLKLTVTGSPGQAYARAASGLGVITPTERYTARMWVYRPVAGDVYASIDWINSVGSYLSTSAHVTAVAAATWTEIQVTGTAPATADRCTFGPTLSGSPATGTVLYTDDVILTAASDRPAVDRNLVLRRISGSAGDWTVAGETGVDGSLRDYAAPGGVAIEYVVRGVAD